MKLAVKERVSGTKKDVKAIRREGDIPAVMYAPGQEAKKIIDKRGEEREKFFLKRLRVDMSDPSLYDLIINTTSYSIDDTAQLIIRGMESAGLVERKR